MSGDDVARAVLGLMDEDVRAKVADGDRSALGELDLTPEEQTLVDDLIEEVAGDEVSGFSMGRSASFAAVSYVQTAGVSNAAVGQQWNAAKTSINQKGNPAYLCLGGDTIPPGPPPPPPGPLCAPASQL